MVETPGVLSGPDDCPEGLFGATARRAWIVPGASDRILAGDILYFAIARDELQDVVSLVGVSKDQRSRILIAGATPVGIGPATRLEGQHFHVVLVEEDEK